MPVEKIKAWRTSDRLLHDSEADALAHERSLTLRQTPRDFCEYNLTCISTPDREAVAEVLFAGAADLRKLLNTQP